MTFRRYVAIGDSATEGLEDPDPRGGYRGWADRLAMIIAGSQDEPLHYANLGIRGLVAAEVRTTQFDTALAMEPDLLTITAGVNDCLGVMADLDVIAEHLAAMWSEARDRDICVMAMTMPDPRRINPLVGRRLRERLLKLNQIQRNEAERYGVLLLDLEKFEMAGDPRLWFDDRLHGNALGHERVARGLAWRLGVEGYDLSWADPLEESEVQIWRDRVQGDLTWARQHFGPWLVRNLRGIRHGAGVTAKRPTLELVEQIDHAAIADAAMASGEPVEGEITETKSPSRPVATNTTVERAELEAFVRPRHHAILSTTRRDGSAQMSPVSCGIDHQGRLVISTYPDRAKAMNLRRRPAVSACILSDDFDGPWVQVYGTAEVIDIPESVEPLVDYFRAISGEHPDWAEYREAMVAQGKSLIRITIDEWGPIATGGFPPQLA